MPVQVLQVVGSQDVDVATAADPGVVDDALGVATLEQALQSLKSVTRLCPMFDEVAGGQVVKAALPRCASIFQGTALFSAGSEWDGSWGVCHIDLPTLLASFPYG